MEAFRDFDLLATPLEGTNLIEASAGTGKSFSIAGLFVRLVVERRIPVGEILVVTFTQAATEDLRSRIRKKLKDAVEAFACGGGGDAFLRELFERCGRDAAALGDLREALRCFDQAAVMTIHGFCRRMLRENAFESGGLFDTELLEDQEDLKREIVEDFWRRNLYAGSAPFVQYAMEKGFLPGNLLSLLGSWYAQPSLEIVPGVACTDAAAEEEAFAASLANLRAAWVDGKEEMAAVLSKTDALSKVTYRREKIPGWVREMDDFISSPLPSPYLFSNFEKFTARGLKRALKKGCEMPAHLLFDLCEAVAERQEALVKRYEERLLALRTGLFAYVKENLSIRKRRNNVQSFDDLLLNLLKALQERGGEELARAVRARFQAALVDEFQDTDPVQYAIFRKIFSREGGILFLIGDPKQAIYGFRGADVFAYMEAAGEVRNRFTLRENWRSEPLLIRAVNTLFENRPHPFAYEGIRFHPSVPAGAGEPEVLIIDGRPEAPLRLWVMEGNGERAGEDIPKGEARGVISRAVGLEISRLLRLGREGRAVLGGRPLREEDIAVLVRRNDEALRMQQILSGLRIPSVLYGSGNLFESHEALELERVLMAVAAPRDRRVLRAALATDMLGLRAEDLKVLPEAEDLWEERVLRFKGYQELWYGRGFMRMFRRLLSQENVPARLMAFPDGERRNTNLLHLGEVLHRVAVEKNLDWSRVLQWLSNQRAGVGTGPDEHPVRLESDESAVRLVTLHKSKGLEYPVVFCPFLWDGSTLRKPSDPFVFHEGESPSGLTLDLGSRERGENRKKAEKERLSENLRLLYVGLTRSKARCYFVWGRFNEAETSAPAYLFYPSAFPEQEDALEATRERYLKLGSEFMGRLRQLEKEAGGAVLVEDLPLRGVQPPPSLPARGGQISARAFSGRIDREWRTASFSSLLSTHGHAAEFADHDSGMRGGEALTEATDPDGEEKSQGIFGFPAGPRAGTFLHALLEQVDFTLEDPDPVRNLIREGLREYGFESRFEEVILEMIRKVVTIPLDPGDPDFRLDRVSLRERLNELEFTFPLKRITAAALSELFGRSGNREVPKEFPDRLGRLEFSPVKGFMKGFMDLVFRFRGRFHLVDWKSNHLGAKVEDYDEPALTRAMLEGNYMLQVHLYALALHQYLKRRVPGYGYESHFGGVYYMFLRGVDPARGSRFGIFRARPSVEFIRLLEEHLIDGTEIED